MLGHEALLLVQNSLSVCKQAVNANIRLNKDLTLYDGGTRFIEDRTCVKLCYVGVREFVENPNKEFSNAEAMIPVVGLFHEVCGHGGQMSREFHKTTPLSKALMLNFCACQCSASYYGTITDEHGATHVDDAYYRQPHETAAQYVGLVAARSFLTGKFGKEKADRMLCDYVNYRVANKSEFIQTEKKYDDFDEALRDFDTAFKQQCLAHHTCVDYIHDTFYASAGAIQTVNNCKSGLRQDVLLAYVYLNRFPGASHMRAEFEALRDIDLSHKAVMSLFPKKPIRPSEIRKSSLSELDRLVPDSTGPPARDFDYGE